MADTAFIFLASVGLTAAWITIFEFVLGNIAALCLRPAIDGAKLTRLHRDGKLHVPVDRVSRFNLRREAVVILLTGWCALSVYLLDNKLERTYFVSRTELPSEYCLSTTQPVFKDLPDERYSALPSNFRVDVPSTDVARRRPCAHGLGLLDFGTNVSAGLVLAPSCLTREEHANATGFDTGEDGDGAFNFSVRLQEPDYLTANEIRYTYPLWYIVPHELNNDRATADLSKPLAECESRGIRSIPVTPLFTWAVRDANSSVVARHVLRSVCATHGDKPTASSLAGLNATAYDYVLRRVWREAMNTFEPQGLRTLAAAYGMPVYNATLPRVATLTGGEGEAATACTNVEAEYEYMLVSEEFLWVVSGGARKNKTGLLPINGVNRTVVIPTNIYISSSSRNGDPTNKSGQEQGRCEPTINALGLAAVVYAAKATWTGENSAGISATSASSSGIGDTLRSMAPHARYQAYMAALARRTFAFDSVVEWSPDQVIPAAECVLQRVRRGTRMSFDFEFFFFLVTAVLCATLIVAALWFRFRLPRQAWSVANYTETLATMRFNDADRLHVPDMSGGGGGSGGDGSGGGGGGGGIMGGRRRSTATTKTGPQRSSVAPLPKHANHWTSVIGANSNSNDQSKDDDEENTLAKVPWSKDTPGKGLILRNRFWKQTKQGDGTGEGQGDKGAQEVTSSRLTAPIVIVIEDNDPPGGDTDATASSGWSWLRNVFRASAPATYRYKIQQLNAEDMRSSVASMDSGRASTVQTGARRSSVHTYHSTGGAFDPDDAGDFNDYDDGEEDEEKGRVKRNNNRDYYFNSI